MSRGSTMIGAVGSMTASTLIIVMLLIAVAAGVYVFETGTQTLTKTIDFSFDQQSNSYMASGSLPLEIKWVKLYVQFSSTAIPTTSLQIIGSDGFPLQLIQGNLNLNSNIGADISGYFQSLSGKSVNFLLSFNPNLPTASLPYLEIGYAPV